METLSIEDLILASPNVSECIVVYIYTQGYCEPKLYDDPICIVKSFDTEIVVNSIVKYLCKMTKYYTIEFDETFGDYDVEFCFDGYARGKIVNTSKTIKFDFANIENLLRTELAEHKFKVE